MDNKDSTQEQAPAHGKAAIDRLEYEQLQAAMLASFAGCTLGGVSGEDSSSGGQPAQGGLISEPLHILALR